jgi:predicted MFS family arabinose efflux permease
VPFVLGALANAVGGWAGDYSVKRMGLRRGRRVVGVAGLVLAAGCLAAVLGTHHRYATLALLAACYAGISFQQPAVWAVCVDIGGRARSGSVSAAMNAAAQLGSFALSMSYGRLVEVTGDYDLALVPVIAVLLCGGLTWLWIDPTERLAA